MSIERLHRAAFAAGYAMAAPDDEPDVASGPIVRRADVPASSNLPAVIPPAQRVEFRGLDLLAPVFAFGARLRGRLPSLGGGAAA